MKWNPAGRKVKHWFFFQDAMCLCTTECFPISLVSHIRATVSFLFFEVPRRKRWCFYCLPISQTFEKLFIFNRDRSQPTNGLCSKSTFPIVLFPWDAFFHRNKILLDDEVIRQAIQNSMYPSYVHTLTMCRSLRTHK